jgi:hypothetical protein
MAPAQVISNMATVAHPHTLAERRTLSQRASETAERPRAPSQISKVVNALKLQSERELNASISARLLSYTYDSICDWIGAQRISYLPPEGSSYDKVLAWTHLFIERLHSLDLGIGELAGDNNLAARLAYGYCANLLEVRFSLPMATYMCRASAWF